jgi:CBS domain-containing protein
MKVATILKQKGQEVFSAKPTDLIQTLSHRLRLARIGAMVVLGKDDDLIGIVSERDIVNGIAEHGADCLSMTVADLMTRQVVTCTSQDSVTRIAQQMTESRIRHLPVVDGTNLVGVVSVGDVVKNRLEEMSLEASVLRDLAIAGH